MSGRLVAGRLAIVTGAGSGIGRASCKLLAREGATVIATDKNYDAAVDTIKNHTVMANGVNGEHSAYELDVSDSKAVKNIVNECCKVYRAPPTIVVSSAGITRDNWLTKLSEMDYDSVIDINLKGTFLVMQAFSQAMIEAKVSGGSIVNIASIVGKYGNMGQTNYCASKAGVVGMSLAAAKELGRHNIRVNVILPGFVDTPMVRSVPEKVVQGMMKLCPLGRFGQPEEVAEVITFLSSDKSSFVTGATVDVTGGY